MDGVIDGAGDDPAGGGAPGDASEPRWTASAVAHHLGVAPATLRSWSARHGIGPAAHEPGRYRRYSAADVAELVTIRRLVDQGMSLAGAAAVARGQRSSGAPPGARGPGPAVGAGGPGPAAQLDELLRVARRLDADALERLLESSLARHGVVATWNAVVRPALATLDDPSPDASEADACVDAALVLAWAVSTGVRRVVGAPPVTPGRRRVLLACSPGEGHTLPLDALLAALHEHQIPAQLLGPSPPADALLHAARETRPVAVLVWAQRAPTARPGVLRSLLGVLDVVAAAGPGWDAARLPARARRVTSMEAAMELARHALDVVSATPAPPG